MLFKNIGLHTERIYNISAGMGICAGDGPGLVLGYFINRGDAFCFGKNNGLHHLSHHTVGKDHHRVAVFFCQIKAFVNEVNTFLNACGSENGDLAVAVVAAAGNLIIVCLSGLNAADAGTAAGNIEHNKGNFGRADKTETLLHKAYSGGR